MKLKLLILSVITSLCVVGCTTRSDIDKAYDLGASDTSKGLYWAMQNVHNSEKYGSKNQNATYRTLALPVEGKNQDGSNYAPHFVKVRVIQDQ